VRLPRSFVGRPFDEALLADLPPGVDPCGECGEFHTFVHARQIFTQPVRVGEFFERDGFRFAELAPARATGA
jgi:diphthamide synthase (EF-2-diphthine--ammonia ligase)